MSDDRAAPMYCPYCGDEDLRPHEQAHGAWECRSCTRVFSVKFVGLLSRSAAAHSGETVGHPAEAAGLSAEAVGR